MTATDDLTMFVKDGLTRGVPRQDLAGALSTAGWDDADIRRALAQFADIAFPLPVPRPRANLSPRDAFVYLLLFGTMYLTAIHIGNLLFYLVDYLLPDPARSQRALEYIAQNARWSAASLVVAAPVYFWLSVITARDIRRSPARRMSWVRRWLTYVTLFLAAALLIGDVTALVYHLLGGDPVARFVLKVLIIAVIAGAIFGHYLKDLREGESGSI